MLLPCVVALLSSPAIAGASVDYPGEVRKHYGVDALPAPPPGCRLCHRDDIGGADTAIQPFGRTLVRLGAQGASIPSLIGALKQVDETGADSDGDGVGDREELRVVSDPNVGTGGEGDPLGDIPFPQTGCALASSDGLVTTP